MRILFITPLLTRFGARWMPIGICSMAAVLDAQGHETMLFDRAAVYDLLGKDRLRTRDAMKRAILRFSPDMIAMSTVSPAIFDTVDCVQFIRTFYNKTVIAGGHHVTALPEMTLRRIPGVDLAVSGEGELVLASLAKGDDPFSIPGISGRKRDGIVSLPPQKIAVLDALPFPKMDILNLTYYLKKNPVTIRGFNLSVATVLTSRGCPHRCAFCTESLTYGPGVRFHSPEYVLACLREITGRYAVNGLYFLDNDFLANRDRAEAICALMMDNGFQKRLKWAIQTRADRIDGPILSVLKKAGCVKIELGIESGHQHHLDQVNKNEDSAAGERSLRLCRKNGVRSHAYMLMGLENETIEGLNRQLAWLKQLKPDTSTWSLLHMYPGTLLYRRKGDRFFETQSWSETAVNAYYSRSHLSGIPDEERRRWVETRLNPWLRQISVLSHLRNNPVSFWFEALARDPLLKLRGVLNHIRTRLYR